MNEFLFFLVFCLVDKKRPTRSDISWQYQFALSSLNASDDETDRYVSTTKTEDVIEVYL